MTNEEAESYVLANLPSTYAKLYSPLIEKDRNADRVIDKALQRLRRRGVVVFDRKGREIIWRVKESRDDR